MTNQDYVTLDMAALSTITGGSDQGSVPICDAETASDAMRKVANGECTAMVHTPGGVIGLSTNRLNQEFQKKNALEVLLQPLVH